MQSDDDDRAEAAPTPREPRRLSLIILPDDVATLGDAPEPLHARKLPKRARTRITQLTPFALRARARASA